MSAGIVVALYNDFLRILFEIHLCRIVKHIHLGDQNVLIAACLYIVAHGVLIRAFCEQGISVV